MSYTFLFNKQTEFKFVININFKIKHYENLKKCFKDIDYYIKMTKYFFFDLCTSVSTLTREGIFKIVLCCLNTALAPSDKSRNINEQKWKRFH